MSKRYNQQRPHDSLLDCTPREFLLSHGQLPAGYTGTREDFPTFQCEAHLIQDMSHLKVVA